MSARHPARLPEPIAPRLVELWRRYRHRPAHQRTSSSSTPAGPTPRPAWASVTPKAMPVVGEPQ